MSAYVVVVINDGVLEYVQVYDTKKAAGDAAKGIKRHCEKLHPGHYNISVEEEPIRH